MSRIVFDNARPVVDTDPARNDIALFVGLVRAAAGAVLPAAVLAWLQAHGWTDGPLARSTDAPFTDIPIPVESYATFTSLFDPGGSSSSYGTDYVAAAVRSFFAQGGRRCYIVRMDDPVTQLDTDTDKLGKLASLLPGDVYAVDDRRSWHGVGHLGGLPEVSFVTLPDLPLLAASQATVASGTVPDNVTGAAQFIVCTPESPEPPATPVYSLPAPRLAPDDYAHRWAPSLQTILQYLSTNGIRNIQLVAAFPMPQNLNPAALIESPSSAVLAQDVHNVITSLMTENIPAGYDNDVPANPGLSTAFLQLTYPWLKTTGSGVLNESLEPPDGVLVGILARNALTRGAFMDAVKVVPAEAFDVSPALPAQELAVPLAVPMWGDNLWKPLITRLSLFGFTPSGLRLLSDVTAYPGEAYRPARVHRLVSVICRAAQQLGERIVFANNGPVLWRRVELTLVQLMTQLWQLNALDGNTTQDAFSVRCDESTMTQNDLDNGRLIAQVTFTAASTIELIEVTLAIETSGASAQSIAVMAGAN